MVTAADLTRLYQRYLGRSPGASDLRIHLGGGLSLADLERTISQSPEARAYAAKRAGTAKAPAPPARVSEADLTRLAGFGFAGRARGGFAPPPPGKPGPGDEAARLWADVDRRRQAADARFESSGYPKEGEQGGLNDPDYQAALSRARSYVRDNAKLVPGAAPSIGVLPGGQLVDLTTLTPTKGDPITQAFATLALDNPKVPKYLDVEAQIRDKISPRGYVLRGEPSAEEQELARRFLAGDRSAAGPLFRARMQRMTVKPRPGLNQIMKPIVAGLVGTGFGAAIGGPVGGVAGAALGGAVGGATSSAINTDFKNPNAVWQGAAIGAGSGLAGAGAGAATSGFGPVVSGAAQGTASAATSTGLSAAMGRDFDLTDLLINAGVGGVTGAASGAVGGGSLGSAIKMGGGTTAGTLRNLLNPPEAQTPPGLMSPQQAAEAERQEQAALLAAQEDWKRRFAEASAAQRAAMQEQVREAQQQWETRREEYQARLRALLAEQEQQIGEALRLMGEAEPGIAAILADRQKQMDQRRAEAEAQEGKLRESRQFFPSALLEQAPAAGEFSLSSLLVGHSPAPVQFGAEGLPASFASYGGPQTPEFSAEGFLPSGMGAESAPPPAVSPLRAPARRPRFVPTLLGGLTRSPYLRSV